MLRGFAGAERNGYGKRKIPGERTGRVCPVRKVDVSKRDGSAEKGNGPGGNPEI